MEGVERYVQKQKNAIKMDVSETVHEDGPG